MSPWDGQQWNYWGGGASTSLRSTNPRPGKVTLDVYRGRKTTLQQQVRPSSLGYPNDVWSFPSRWVVPTIWITVGQGPTALEVGAGGGCSDIFSLEYPFSPLSPSLWGTVRYRLKYHLNGPLDPKQSTNQSPAFELHYIQTDCVFKEVIEISGRKPNHQKHAVLYHLYFIFKLSIYSFNFSVEFFPLP